MKFPNPQGNVPADQIIPFVKEAICNRMQFQSAFVEARLAGL